MKSFKTHLTESKLVSVLEMNDEQFDALIDGLSEAELTELEEGILGAIGKGVKAVAKGAVAGVKKVANRVSTSGRADAAQAKLAKIQKKKADQSRLAKAKADIAKAKAPAKPAAPAKPKQPVAASYGESVSIEDTVKAIMEDGYSQVVTGDGSDLAHNDIKNPDVLEQLNAHIGMIGKREYINPKGAILQLQGKLATIGLTFDIPALPEQKGTVTAALTQFGGITGKSVTTPIDELDNDNPAEGLNIQFEYEKYPTGCTKVYAKIV